MDKIFHGVSLAQRVLHMPGTEIRVMAYSGYRNEETPRKMIFRDRRIEVVEIVSRWIEEDIEDRSIKRFFKVKGSDGCIHTVYYDEKRTAWFLKL